jgi:hypothetical protein
LKTPISYVTVLGAALLFGAPASAADAAAARTSGPRNHAPNPPPSGPNNSHTDVPAPPMLLLFGIGAAGLIWGRRLAAKANADKS